MEEAEEGVIIFSMGISLGVNMPCRVFTKLISAFSRLRQRVIFRAFPDCDITEEFWTPSNVMLENKACTG